MRMGTDHSNDDTGSIGVQVQRSFNRLGMPLEGRSIKVLGGVGKGYALEYVTALYFRDGAECVLQERDPAHAGKMRVAALFPSAQAVK